MSDEPGPVSVEVVSPDPGGHGGNGIQWQGQVGVICGVSGQFVVVRFESGTRAAFDPTELRSFGE